MKLFVAVIGLSAIFSGVAVAEAVAEESTRIGFVNFTRVIEQAPQAKVVRENLQTEFAPRDAKLFEDQKEIKSMDDRLVRDGALMSATEKRKMERNIKSKQQAFQSAYKKFAEDIEARQNEELQKMQQELSAVVVEVAKGANFDMVIETGVVYANEKVNITQLVIDALHAASTIPAE